MSVSEFNLKYRSDIDGLRALAVLAVVIFHAFPTIVPGGFTGVDIFFVISGYLISTIIFESLNKSTFSFIEFYARRIRRIFPALILVLMSSFLFGWFVMLADEMKQLGKHIVGGALFILNFILWSESSYFDNAVELKPLVNLWSLAVEEQFYLVWPLMLWAAYKMRRNLLSLVVAICLISFFQNLYQIKSDSIGDFYSPFTRFWELMFGSILAWLLTHKSKITITDWRLFPQDFSKIIQYVVADGRYSTLLINTIAFIGMALIICGFFILIRQLVFLENGH